MTIDDIRADFALLDDWEDRYRYVIELGRALPPFPEELRTDANKVRGCASQVWLATERVASPAIPQSDRMAMQGTSDAHIVQGLIAVLFAIYDGKTAGRDRQGRRRRHFLPSLGSEEHLTQQRSNGLASMVKRIRSDAEMMLTA